MAALPVFAFLVSLVSAFAGPSPSRSFYDRNGSFAVDSRGTARPTILIGDINRRNVVTPEGAQ